jgi:hypothetical protein
LGRLASDNSPHQAIRRVWFVRRHAEFDPVQFTQEEEIRQGIVNVRVSGLLPRLFRESTKIITNPAEFRLTFFIGSGEKWGVVAENVTRNLRWHE